MPMTNLNGFMRASSLILAICAIDNLVLWSKAEAATPGYSQTDIKKWVQDAESLREQGDLISAQKQLEQSWRLAGNRRLPSLDMAAVELALGYNLLLLNRITEAEQHLTTAYPLTAGDTYLNALADQYLASLYLANADAKQASSYVEHGLKILQSTAHADLKISLALLNESIKKNPPSAQASTLLSLASRIARLDDGTIKSKLILKSVQQMLNLQSEALPTVLVSALQQQSYQLLTPLLLWADQTPQLRLKAEATGQMAGLYQWQGRLAEGLSLFEQAITLAEKANEKALLAQLAAQKGQLLRSQGNVREALATYELAANNLHLIRADIPINLADGRSAVANIIDPIYRNYADLLLKAGRSDGTELADQRLIKAIDAMEAVKEADMQDFFLGRCTIGGQGDQSWKQRTFPQATVFYPILLPDRIELLLISAQKLIRHTVPVSAEKVQEQVSQLTYALHRGRDYRASSKQLYEWLYAPIKDDLLQSKPEVILFVPDRSLRAVPLAALYDGKTFTIEQYGIVTLPSLNLQRQPGEINRDNRDIKSLLAGLSKPDGASIDQLPRSITANLSDSPLDREEIIEELSLPSVEEEIKTLADKEKSRTLLNSQFTAEALKQDIETGEFSNVHIASHGYFGKNARESFIMAYDRNMTLLDIKDTLEVDKLKEAPIDLLTLSACKTAEGDDTMLLGFSGLAVKSNVLSAVGSLWSISDNATMEFMRLFYDGLDHSLSKAQAIREAQINMLKNKQFRHPFYWSPFILVGNWQ